MRILVVEDERAIADFVARGLQAEGHVVGCAEDGLEGERRALDEPIDLLVLDLMLPGKDGLDVLETVREAKPALPIVCLTARAEVEDRVNGLDRGATDYVVKPFAFAELAARVQALARRPPVGTPPVLESAGVVLDVPRFRAFRDGRLLDLTPKEFAVLNVLMQADGAVVSAEELLEKAWDEHADPFTNAVRVAVMTLRRKLGDPPVIATVPRVGYRFGEISEA